MVNEQQSKRSLARFLRGTLLFVFAAAAILPFCSSFFLCSMPCCHLPASPQSALTIPMPACPGSSTEGCAPTVSAATDRTAATPAAPAASGVSLVVIRTAVVFSDAGPVRSGAAPVPLAAPAAIHVLNSVFRI